MVSSSRAPRTPGGQFARKSGGGHAAVARTRPASKTPTIELHNGLEIANSDSDGFGDDGPPAKKRKLSIRHRQSTLDGHFAPVQSPAVAGAGAVATKPPTKLSVTQPHGQVLETVNGVRHALDINEDELAGDGHAGKAPRRTPQPEVKQKAATVPPDKKEDKRTLRSQDEGPRLKSELATYFPEYEDVVFGVEKEADFITVDTALYVTDDAARQQQAGPGVAQSSPQRARGSPSHMRNGSANGVTAPTTPERTISQRFNGCSPIDLDVLARNTPSNPSDPLDDAHFFKSHRRAERKEKQLRNIERERAMHEKVQLERLLDGLQGHDWLKVLGVTGITDGEAKKYEPKRDYFINEVQVLVDKFKQWKEQERKQRLEKEAAARRAEEKEESGDAETGAETEESSVEPPSSELNASASRQLLQETTNTIRSGFKIRLSRKGGVTSNSTPTTLSATPSAAINHSHTITLSRPLNTSHPHPSHSSASYPPPSPELPITSFYAKRHLRDAALSKTRQSGRSITAFGHAIPEMEEREFEVPRGYATEEALRANARERRRRRREGVVDAATTAGAEAGGEGEGRGDG